MDYYVDCEFDGHQGPLLSIAVVPSSGMAFYGVTYEKAKDKWVVDNVVPYLHDTPRSALRVQASTNELGPLLKEYFGKVDTPTFHSDSPVDIVRLLGLLSTDEEGNWSSSGFSKINCHVHNVDCWPNSLVGAIQHNSFWDAVALKLKIEG